MSVIKCRLCDRWGFDLEPVLTLPNSALANELLNEPTKQDEFPLQVCICTWCGTYQLSESVSAERLFRNYLYVAGTSPVNVEHFKNYAKSMVDKFELKPGDLVVEIASNDGVLLQAFKDLGMNVLGIDPARNIAEVANKNGIPTIAEFFSRDIAKQIVKDYGPAKLVCANNVLAHTDQVREITWGVIDLLDNDGAFVWEVSYFLDVYEKLLFDTIYHEHYLYHLVGTFSDFFINNGMWMFDVERIPNHGGSIRGFCKKKYTPSTERKWDLIKLESELSVYLPKKYPEQLERVKEKFCKYKQRIDLLGKNLKDKLIQYKKEGKKIGMFGYAAKTTTLLYTFDIGAELIDFVIDDNPLKQNLLTPGKHIPVYSSTAIQEQKPDILVIGSWNFADSIINKHKQFIADGGTWIVPVPEFKEYKLRNDD